MDRSDRYRHFAKECLDLARTALSEQSKATFLVMAQVWNCLADERDRQAKVIKRTNASRKTH
jgi:phytoene/squalene synthetase